MWHNVVVALSLTFSLLAKSGRGPYILSYFGDASPYSKWPPKLRTYLFD